MRTLPGAALLAFLLAGPAVGQSWPSKDVHFPLRLLGLGLRATRSGILVGAAPSADSRQGGDSTAYVGLRLHPDSVMAWLPQAQAVLSRPVYIGPDERIQWTRDLRSHGDGGSLALGRAVKDGRLRGQRWLVIGDRRNGWQLELTQLEADSLLSVLLELATVSGLPDSAAGRADAEATGTPDTTVYVDDNVDEPVLPVHMARPRYPPDLQRWGQCGFVELQYIVDANGHPEPGSFRVLRSTHPLLTEPAIEAIRHSRYSPALVRGRPVRQRVQQRIVFRIGDVCYPGDAPDRAR